MSSITIIKSFFFKNNYIIYAFLISLVIKIIYLIFLSNLDLNSLHGDQFKYWTISDKIFDQKTYFGKEYGSLRVPVYPLFLAFLKSMEFDVYNVISLQLIINFLVLFLIYKIGCLFDKKVGNIAIIISSLSLNLLNSSLFILTESIFLPLFLLYIYFLFKFLRKKNYKLKYLILSSLFLGLATLTRPISLYFFIFIFFFFFKKNLLLNLMSVLIFSLIFSIVLSPWCYRNYKLFNNYSLSSSSGTNLAGYYLPYLSANYENKSFSEMRKLNYIQLKKTINYEQNPFDYSNDESKYFFDKVKNYPLSIFFETWIEGNLKFIFTPPIVDFYYMLNIKKTNFSEIKESSFLKSVYIYLFDNENKQFSFSIILSIIIIVFSRILSFLSLFFIEKKDYLITSVIISIIFLNLILTGPVGSARYRIIVEPFFIIMLSVSLNTFIRKFFKNEK